MPWIQAICAATDGPDKPAMTAGERSALAVNVLIIHIISEMCVRPRDEPGHDGMSYGRAGSSPRSVHPVGTSRAMTVEVRPRRIVPRSVHAIETPPAMTIG